MADGPFNPGKYWHEYEDAREAARADDQNFFWLIPQLARNIKDFIAAMGHNHGKDEIAHKFSIDGK